MAGLPAKLRLQPTAVKSAVLWGVAAATGGLYLVQENVADAATMAIVEAPKTLTLQPQLRS
ncbi:hypothetical protein Lal_00020606 [Lupinus albus]|nr:hypothetical protein Lal_00020606 [Lupinus albus]